MTRHARDDEVMALIQMVIDDQWNDVEAPPTPEQIQEIIPDNTVKTAGRFVQVEPGPRFHTLACMNVDRGNVEDNTPEGDIGEGDCICSVGLRTWVEVTEEPAE